METKPQILIESASVIYIINILFYDCCSPKLIGNEKCQHIQQNRQGPLFKTKLSSQLSPSDKQIKQQNR
jgi:hypothetical protein